MLSLTSCKAEIHPFPLPLHCLANCIRFVYLLQKKHHKLVKASQALKKWRYLHSENWWKKKEEKSMRGRETSSYSGTKSGRYKNLWRGSERGLLESRFRAYQPRRRSPSHNASRETVGSGKRKWRSKRRVVCLPLLSPFPSLPCGPCSRHLSRREPYRPWSDRYV